MILLLISFPVKSISLIFLILYGIHWLLFKKKTVSYGNLFIILLLGLNAVFTVAYFGLGHLKNFFLFILFIIPIIFILFQPKEIVTDHPIKAIVSSDNLKKLIEHYLVIQIMFSIISIIVRGSQMGFKFDVNFGDAIAGTFRNPLVYNADASNVIFAFTMIIVMLFYKFIYKKETNKIIEYASYFIIFLASVNHLIICLVFALVLATISLKRIVLNIFLLILGGYLFFLVSPNNFNLIFDRFNAIISFTSGSGDALQENLKIQFLSNFLQDFSNEIIRFSSIGVGAGNYSSRAALFFTGEYVNSFKFVSISPLMAANTYPLWKELLTRPPWLQGAFHFPYGSLFTFIAELGLLTTIFILGLIIKKLKEFPFFTKRNLTIFLVFILLASVVDNYLEYYQSTFIVYFLLSKYRQIHLQE